MDPETQFKVDIAEALARIETKQDDMRRELLGNGQPGRIQLLEAEVASQARRQWWHTSVILPIGAALHGLAQHFGIKI